MADGKHCLRCKKKVSLMFIDADGFSRINAIFGHWAGVQALVEMGPVPSAGFAKPKWLEDMEEPNL